MKILIVCSGTKKEFSLQADQVFIYEQVEAISERSDIVFEYFLINKKGLIGYIKSYFELRQKVRSGKYDLLHGHYGFSAFLAASQFGHKTIATFHGSDINRPLNRVISFFATRMADWSVFVSERLREKIPFKIRHYSIIPCGVNLEQFRAIDKMKAREKMNLDADKKYILFASSFDNPVKNYPLAQQVLNQVGIPAEMIELKGCSREEVNLFLNACDVLVMTSTAEGSPQVIKEGMACGIPVVATDVGDVSQIMGDTEGCYLAGFDVPDFAGKLRQALAFSETRNRTHGRARIKKLGLDSGSVAGKILDIYNETLEQRKK